MPPVVSSQRLICRTVSRAAVAAALVLLTAGAIADSGEASAAQQERPTSQVPTLGRPTRPDDPAPLLDFDRYFKGTWNVSWEYPESPLGPADVVDGTTTYRQVGPTTFEASSALTSSTGAFTVTETFEYQRAEQTITRTVVDSRGYTYTQTGTVTGDLGGQFTIRLDGKPFTHQGKTVRVNSLMRLLSPFNFRVQFTLSAGDGPFTNFGNPWWRKETAP